MAIEISNSPLSYVSPFCFAVASVIIGEKFCKSAVCKIGSVVAGILGKENASEWDKASSNYLALAKKNLVRDLTAAGGYILAGIFAYAIFNGVPDPKAEQKVEKKLTLEGQDPKAEQKVEKKLTKDADSKISDSKLPEEFLEKLYPEMPGFEDKLKENLQYLENSFQKISETIRTVDIIEDKLRELYLKGSLVQSFVVLDSYSEVKRLNSEMRVCQNSILSYKTKAEQDESIWRTLNLINEDSLLRLWDDVRSAGNYQNIVRQHAIQAENYLKNACEKCECCTDKFP